MKLPEMKLPTRQSHKKPHSRLGRMMPEHPGRWVLSALGVAAGALAVGAFLRHRRRYNGVHEATGRPRKSHFDWRETEGIEFNLPDETAVFPAERPGENRSGSAHVGVIATNAYESQVPKNRLPGLAAVAIRVGSGPWRIGLPHNPAIAYGPGVDGSQKTLALPLNHASTTAAFGVFHEGVFTPEATNAVESMPAADLPKNYPNVPLANL